MTKQDRCDRCNELIRIIGSLGRHFFRYSQKTNRGRVTNLNSYDFSWLEVGPTGHVFFHDACSGKRIYTHYPYGWKGFSQGGTLYELVKAMRDYIRTGEPIRGHLGPAPSWYSGGDPWGYREDMDLVREAAVLLGVYDHPRHHQDPS